MIILLMIILLIFWLLIGLFGSIMILNRLMDNELDRQDYIFASVISIAGPINILILLIFLVMDLGSDENLVIVRSSKPKLTLKQERVKKLKRLKKVSWFRFW